MEMLDYPSWRWCLSLIALTMAFHAVAIVMMGIVAVKIRVRLEARESNLWNLIPIMICIVTVIGLLLAVALVIECGIWAAAYLWSPRRLALFHRLDEHARRIRAHAATPLAVDGCSGGSQRDATVRCEHRMAFHGGASVLVNDRRARDSKS
jgi:hypothetical protein